MQNFNKLIDIQFIGAADSFEIKTPLHGQKPYIEITGEQTTKALIANYNIKVGNLYTDRVLSDYHKVIVSAGYENKMSVAFEGEVLNICTATPSPDKMTDIMVATANMSDWITKTINVKLAEGFKLSDAVKQISNALDYQEPSLENDLQELTSSVPFECNGTARQALDGIKKIFSDLDFFVLSNRINVITQANPNKVANFKLNYLLNAPQFSGGIVNITAPWEPALKPGDTVEFPIDYYQTATVKSDKIKNKAKVISVQFAFSTYDTNEMNITGTVI